MGNSQFNTNFTSHIGVSAFGVAFLEKTDLRPYGTVSGQVVMPRRTE